MYELCSVCRSLNAGSDTTPRNLMPIILAFFCLLWNPGPAWTGLRHTNSLSLSKWPGRRASLTRKLNIIVDQFGHMGLQLRALGCWIPKPRILQKESDHGFERLCSHAPGSLVTSHQPCPSRRDGGWKVKEEPSTRIQTLPQGGPKILCGGWAQG